MRSEEVGSEEIDEKRETKDAAFKVGLSFFVLTLPYIKTICVPSSSPAMA